MNLDREVKTKYKPQFPLPIPACQEVDFSDSCQVEGYGHLLASAYRNCNGFEQSVLSPENLRIRKEGQSWIKKVEERLPYLSGIHIQRYLDWYDLVHRVAYGKEADFKFIHSNMKKAMTDMAKGEKADKIGFANWIRSNEYFHHDEIDPDLLLWYQSSIKRWIKNFHNNGVLIDENLENLRIINFLLEENLDIWNTGGEPFKRKLIDPTIPYLQNILFEYDIPEKYNRIQLEAINGFAFLAGLEIPELRYDKVRVKVLEKLTRSESLDPYSRKAYRLDLTYEFRSEDIPVLP